MIVAGSPCCHHPLPREPSPAFFWWFFLSRHRATFLDLRGMPSILQNGAVRIVDQASLAGKTPCSEGRGGLDRWCVFFKQKQSATRGQDVWAVNVSRIGRGENVQCNQPSLGLRGDRLGDHVVHWGFVADTLVIDGVPPGTSASARVSAPGHRLAARLGKRGRGDQQSGQWVLGGRRDRIRGVCRTERRGTRRFAQIQRTSMPVRAIQRTRRRPARCRNDCGRYFLRRPPYPETPHAHRGSARTRAGSGAAGERQSCWSSCRPVGHACTWIPAAWKSCRRKSTASSVSPRMKVGFCGSSTRKPTSVGRARLSRPRFPRAARARFSWAMYFATTSSRARVRRGPTWWPSPRHPTAPTT
jgi:hypothetical protein